MVCQRWRSDGTDHTRFTHAAPPQITSGIHVRKKIGYVAKNHPDYCKKMRNRRKELKDYTLIKLVEFWEKSRNAD